MSGILGIKKDAHKRAQIAFVCLCKIRTTNTNEFWDNSSVDNDGNINLGIALGMREGTVLGCGM